MWCIWWSLTCVYHLFDSMLNEWKQFDSPHDQVGSAQAKKNEMNFYQRLHLGLLAWHTSDKKYAPIWYVIDIN